MKNHRISIFIAAVILGLLPAMAWAKGLGDQDRNPVPSKASQKRASRKSTMKSVAGNLKASARSILRKSGTMAVAIKGFFREVSGRAKRAKNVTRGLFRQFKRRGRSLKKSLKRAFKKKRASLRPR